MICLLVCCGRAFFQCSDKTGLDPPRCNAEHPCDLDPTTCSTGVAGGLVTSPHNYFCSTDYQKSAEQNGAGNWCVNMLTTQREGARLEV